MPGTFTPKRRWTITLAVIPFSYDERDEARRFLIGNPRPTAEGNSGTDSSDAVMSSLLATSISRKPMRRFRWKLK